MSDDACLQVPIDFERIPEFRALCGILMEKTNKPATRMEIEAHATFLWMRLHVELGLLARQTNRPGYLTRLGVKLFRDTVDDLFGDDVDVVRVLTDAGLLTPTDVPTVFFCDLFARRNGHLSGDYVRREVKGASVSALVRQQKQMERHAYAQAMLLPTEVFKSRSGLALNSTEINRCMVLIGTLDKCLGLAVRPKSQFTEGLIADAHEAVQSKSAEELRELYVWIMNHRQHPALPNTTEGILRDWEKVGAIGKAKG